tara:strand:- start:274 stop:594 length:321 start_codon:yes stop_codon:yes gene_type:complete
MKTEKIIEHITKSFNKYLDNSGCEKHFPNYKKESWTDLIIRESEEEHEAVEILFDGGYCYDMINKTWSSCGDFCWETAEEMFGLDSLEKKGHEAEPYASWKISIYN